MKSPLTDKSPTADVTSRRAAIAVVSTALQLGRQLDRTVVAEGVADEPTLQALREPAWTRAQG